MNSLPMYKKIYDTPQEFEGPFGPSMVEPCHNLSLEELVRDYTRGIVHSERQAFYDDGDDVPDEMPFVPHDLAEMPMAPQEPAAAPTTAAPQAQPRKASKRSEQADQGENGELGRGVGEGSEGGAAPPPADLSE